ncbi:MAG: hypothetical protein ACP5MW_00025 [Thermoplasmata archaeon]
MYNVKNLFYISTILTIVVIIFIPVYIDGVYTVSYFSMLNLFQFAYLYFDEKLYKNRFVKLSGIVIMIAIILTTFSFLLLVMKIILISLFTSIGLLSVYIVGDEKIWK